MVVSLEIFVDCPQRFHLFTSLPLFASLVATGVALHVSVAQVAWHSISFQSPQWFQMLTSAIQSLHVPGLRHSILHFRRSPRSDTRSLRQSDRLQASPRSNAAAPFNPQSLCFRSRLVSSIALFATCRYYHDSGRRRRRYLKGPSPEWSLSGDSDQGNH